jgi:preprotein translocase subunit SecG
MNTVLLVIHIMIAAALVGIVLMQRSEGGALGMGGGGFMSGRGQANFLTRMTAYLAAAFFLTSIALTLLANQTNRARSVFDTPAASTPGTGTPGTGGTPMPAAPATTGAPGAPVTPTVPGVTVQPATPSVPAAPAVPAPPRGGILDKIQPKAP